MSSVIYLQGIGEKPAKMVSELSEGDIFLKNYGYKYRIIACESLSENVYELTFESLNSTDPGCRYSKTVRGSTLVGIHEDEGVQDLNEDMRLMQQLHMAQKRATDRKRREDEERERKRRENQELSANKQVSGEFAGAREETIADKILNFMSERKFSKAEIKKRKKVGDKLPKGEFKKNYPNPRPPAKSWKDVLWATATNIVKGKKTEESVELDETRDRAELINLMNRTGEKVASDTKTDKGRVTPKTNQALRINIKARKRLGLPVESVELDELKTPTYKSYKRKADKQEKDLFDKGYSDLSPEEKKKADKRREGINRADKLIRKRREGLHRDPPRPGRERIQDEVVKEAIADGKPKSKSQRRMDVAISKIDRAFPETKNQKWAKQRGGFSGYDRIQSAASRMQRGHDPEKMKKEPDDVFQNTSDVRAAEKLMKKRRQRSKKASIQDSVQKNILSQLKNFDLSGEGLDIPAINNKKWGTEGFKNKRKNS